MEEVVLGNSNTIFAKQREQSLNRVAEYFSAMEDFELINEDNQAKKKSNDCEIWSGSIIASGETWPVLFIFTKLFPIELPKVVCDKAKKLYLYNPHVFANGWICIFSDSVSVNINNIEDLLSIYLHSLRRILSGVPDVDFRDEFSVYWDRKLSPIHKTSCIVSPPKLLKDTFYFYSCDNSIFIAKDKLYLNNWLKNYFVNFQKIETSTDGICLNLDLPLIPSEYPDNCFDLLELAKKRDLRAYKLISEKLVTSNKPGLVLLKQKTDTGFSLGCIEFNSPRLNYYKKLQKGFRKGNIPTKLLIDRGINIVKGTNVNRNSVIRTDYDWIHSRGGDGCLNFHNKAVVIIGCGSVGGYIAHTLAKSGISKLLLIDKEDLEWSNIGRHILGAQYVSTKKALALQKYISQDMPHLNVEAKCGNWIELFENDNTLFNDYDIVVSSIADWNHEKLLNKLVLNHDISTALFTWLEPYAVAGHCFITSNTGCLNCYMNDLGQFNFAISSENKNTLIREPGGCTFYQPYGPTALLNTVTMACRIILKHLNKPIDSILYSWISDEDHYNDLGVKISDKWIDLINEKGYSRIYETVLPSKNCQLCKK
jgi:hypothetical protein